MFRLPEDLAEHFRGGGALIVPTRQRVRAVQLAVAAGELAAGRSVWASPDVLTPASFRQRACERAAAAGAALPGLLSAAQEWALWRAAAREASDRLGYFLDDGPLGEALARSHELALDYELSVARSPGAESELYSRARAHFESRCRELGAQSPGSLAGRLPPPHVPPPALLRGFTELPPRLCALGLPGGTAPVAAEPRVLRAADRGAEQEAIAAWCRARLAANPAARLLVLLPGPPGARERLRTLIAQALDPGSAVRSGASGRLVTLEGGEPLADQALPAQALTAFALLTGAALDAAALSEWLRAPFFARPTAASRAALAQFVAERGGSAMRLTGLRGLLQSVPPELRPGARELDGQLQRAAAALNEGGASGSRRWSERFAAALAALTLTHEGEAPDLARLQLQLRLRELLQEFGELGAAVGSLAPPAAVQLLRARARAVSYRPSDEDAPVTLSAVLADPVIGYDGIWVAGLTADVLPKPAAPDPFLPLAAQRTAGLAQASEAGRRAEAQRLLTRWAAASPELVLSHPRLEGDLECLASPLTAGCADFEGARQRWLPIAMARAGQTEDFLDERGLPWPSPAQPLPSGTRALSLQNSCPFRAYAELRLGALERDSTEPGVPMDQRGLLLHAALQRLWDRLKSQAGLNGQSADGLRALIRAAVAEAAQALITESRTGRRGYRAPDGQFDLFTQLPPALVRESRRAEGLILKLCDLERTRPEFVVEATEAVAELRAGGGRVRMRLDRIDRIGEGRAVLDYKSGKPGTPDWFGDRPTHPQLLAYLTALGADVAALATVNLTAREVRFTGVALADGLLPKVPAAPPHEAGWAGHHADWGRRMGDLVAQFLSGDARVDPAPGACQWCHLAALCRIGPADLLGTAAEDGHE
ncbi:MAG: PD-(D/E)XK nuclease family protein [Proteobacteria bacterium]|nr:PD-(D/E)XK nuclease family protein [Pseudomonadota bacterium]